MLRAVRDRLPSTVCGVLYERMGALPHFNPDDDAEGATPHPEVATLRRAVHDADGVLICTPEYAGALPGSLKNLLEWTIGDAGTYGKPVAWINAAGPAAPTGASDAHASLRTVLKYAGADIAEQACRRIPVTRAALGSGGDLVDLEALRELDHVVRSLIEHVRLRGAADLAGG